MESTSGAGLLNPDAPGTPPDAFFAHTTVVTNSLHVVCVICHVPQDSADFDSFGLNSRPDYRVDMALQFRRLRDSFFRQAACSRILNMFQRFIPVALICAIAFGCSKSKTPSPQEGVSSVGSTEAEAKRLPKRESVEGKWVYLLAQSRSATPLAILDVRKLDDGYSAEVIVVRSLQGGPETEQSKLTSTEAAATAESVSFKLKYPFGTFDFTGRLEDGQIRGNTFLPDNSCSISWLSATEATNVDDLPPESVPGADTLDGLAAADIDVGAQMRSFANSNPASPASVHALLAIVSEAKKEEQSEATLLELGNELESCAGRWGDRFLAKTYLDMAEFPGWAAVRSTSHRPDGRASESSNR